MRATGFSTGALTKGDFSQALSWLSTTDSDAIELSALREHELRPLLEAIEHMDLSRYRYRAIHAPKEFKEHSEAEVAAMLLPFASLGFNIVLHPDAISDPVAWRPLGQALCLENMDIRKPTARTTEEMEQVFKHLPDARLCLDLGHARQVDPSMAIAFRFVAVYGDRIAQVHISEVDTSGDHWAMSRPCLTAFVGPARHLPDSVAVIIESKVSRDGVAGELEKARELFNRNGEHRNGK